MMWAIIEYLIRNISGTIGIRIRRFYYKNRLNSCGTKITISEGVYFDNPKNINIGNYVWIDRNCILIAGEIESPNIIIKNESIEIKPGEVHIGNNAHIGIGTIIQGHGGIRIGDNFTSSPGVKIYSLSNDVKTSKNGTNPINKNLRYYIQSPLIIGKNVWMGINSIMVSGMIGDDCFINPNCVINSTFEPNCIISGNPANSKGSRF